jgi:CBS domain-containing protein
MKVAEVMTRDVAVVSPDDPIQEAAREMQQIDAGSLPVGEDDRLVGMITDRDLAVRAVAENRSPATTKVRDVMSRGIRYCFEDEDVSTVALHMADWKVRRLAVLSRDKQLVGIVSLGDLTAEQRPEIHDALRSNSYFGDDA